MTRKAMTLIIIIRTTFLKRKFIELKLYIKVSPFIGHVEKK